MKITQDYLKELFEYKNGKLYWKIPRGNAVKAGDRAGSLNQNGYRYISIDNKGYSEHRLIWLFHKGYLPKFLDHINRNRSDNRIENLREATTSQNNHNRNKKKGCSSKYQGVYWHKAKGKWKASIGRDRKVQKHLGYYTVEIEAAKAYNIAAKAYFGKDFANLNKI